jgi:hypothetical protein
MKIHNSELECTFEFPDPLSYRLALRYDSEVEMNFDNADLYGRLWRGVQQIAVNWQCPHIGIAANLDDVQTEKGLEVIKWAGLMAFSYRQELKNVPLASSAQPLTPLTAADNPPQTSALPGSVNTSPEASPTPEA